ncbi:DUF1127 domain-containing protein [Roseovarius sp. SYSU LYC5161]|uniref:DUF1127 domain-containing protein n=1 Tax=Roseovarius halophilus (ex Wu et al. 2025) TaxID=3376060 RepID=UPI002870E4FB|nr:DUF1127 domain-containing protein [Roseovarius sp.]
MTFLSQTQAVPRSGALFDFPLRAALQVRRERRALARLPDSALRDLGLTRAEARAEARRDFWDVPVARSF